MFGFKQRGEDAVKNLNVYYYMMYDDQIDLDSLEIDSTQRIAMET